MLCIIKAIIASAILMFIGTNLIGLVVRGLKWSPPAVESPTDRVYEILQDESRRLSRANIAMTLGGILLTVVFLIGLFYFWNLWLAASGLVVMIARVPDLIWELKSHGDSLVQTRPEGFLYVAASILMWGTPVLVWHSLCHAPH